VKEETSNHSAESFHLSSSSPLGGSCHQRSSVCYLSA